MRRTPSLPVVWRARGGKNQNGSEEKSFRMIMLSCFPRPWLPAGAAAVLAQTPAAPAPPPRPNQLTARASACRPRVHVSINGTDHTPLLATPLLAAAAPAAVQPHPTACVIQPGVLCLGHSTRVEGVAPTAVPSLPPADREVQSGHAAKNKRGARPTTTRARLARRRGAARRAPQQPRTAATALHHPSC